jgi:hypothetical protein
MNPQALAGRVHLKCVVAGIHRHHLTPAPGHPDAIGELPPLAMSTSTLAEIIRA